MRNGCVGPESPFDGLTRTECKVLEVLHSLGVSDVVHTGWPDFMVPIGDTLLFVEVKNGENDTPRSNQERVHKILRDKGFMVVVVNAKKSRAALERILNNFISSLLSAQTGLEARKLLDTSCYS